MKSKQGGRHDKRNPSPHNHQGEIKPFRPRKILGICSTMSPFAIRPPPTRRSMTIMCSAAPSAPRNSYSVCGQVLQGIEWGIGANADVNEQGVFEKRPPDRVGTTVTRPLSSFGWSRLAVNG